MLKSKNIQKEMNSKTLEQLSTLGVNESSRLCVEFFFYTKYADKASNLAIDLSKLGYKIETVDRSAGDKRLYVISGWTTKIKMDSESLTDWTSQMYKLGCEHDCDFDGWGTFPDQDIEN